MPTYIEKTVNDYENRTSAPPTSAPLTSASPVNEEQNKVTFKHVKNALFMSCSDSCRFIQNEYKNWGEIVGDCINPERTIDFSSISLDNYKKSYQNSEDHRKGGSGFIDAIDKTVFSIIDTIGEVALLALAVFFRPSLFIKQFDNLLVSSVQPVVNALGVANSILEAIFRTAVSCIYGYKPDEFELLDIGHKNEEFNSDIRENNEESDFAENVVQNDEEHTFNQL